jgi:hypothetical protein
VPTIVFSKVVNTEYTFKHLGEVTQKDACQIAEKRAKEKAIKEALGLKISLDEIRKCKETDGVLECEDNQTSVLSLNGDIKEYKIINKEDGVDELSDPKIYFCKIEINADVVPSFENNLNIEFNIALNQVNFRSGEKISMDFLFSEELYLTVYQYYPYKKIDRVQKLFPNKYEKDNKISLKNFKLPTDNLEYTVLFPDKISRDRVDEHLIFITTKKNVGFLDTYFSLEDLTKRLMEIEKKNIVRKEQKTYTIYK